MFDELNPPFAAPADHASAPSASGFRNVPHAAESFGTVPHVSESFGNVPQGAEAFRTVPKPAEPDISAELRERYTLTVRETARLFETAGVARSERSIVNWCQQNRQGIARLDAYFDPNERRYLITRQSADSIIAEEKARAAKAHAEPVPPVTEERGTEPKPAAEAFRKVPNPAEDTTIKQKADADELAELQKENLDLKITNRGKDYFIEQMKIEREGLLKQLVDSSHRVGQLETKLLLSGSQFVDRSTLGSDPGDDLIQSR